MVRQTLARTTLLLLFAATATAQNFPDRPIRIVTAEAGGSQDVAARILAVGLTAALGQQVIIDNRASGVIPGEVVMRAKPDGHTLLIYAGTFWLQPFVRKSVPYDPVRDFSPITLVVTSPTVLVVHPALPVKSVKDLIALVKTRPGELNYAMGSAGSANHLAAELFKSMTGADMLGIGYRGNGPAVNALISGQVQLMFATASSVTPLVKSGRLRAIAHTAPHRLPDYPDLPTVAETVPDYAVLGWNALVAPAGLPPQIERRLSDALRKYTTSPEFVRKLKELGTRVDYKDGAALRSMIQQETVRWEPIVKSLNLKPN